MIKINCFFLSIVGHLNEIRVKLKRINVRFLIKYQRQVSLTFKEFKLPNNLTEYCIVRHALYQATRPSMTHQADAEKSTSQLLNLLTTI